MYMYDFDNSKSKETAVTIWHDFDGDRANKFNNDNADGLLLRYNAD